ncbi:MAG: response regulator [Candidatus Lernaella stagnicola]|nr:response regulator [Candidatus Lernaella stagnicola]
MSQKSVLVIDDIEENSDIIQTKLSFAGYNVTVADDGETGIEIARRDKPDLILCDIMLPKMDGWDVLANLRDNAETAEIPVIFMTAYTTIQFSGEKRRAIERGAVDYLKKPFDLGEMLELVRKHIGP